MSIKKQTIDETDDGRVIVPMNVPGMPWHESSLHGYDSSIPVKKQDEKKANTSGNDKAGSDNTDTQPPVMMTRKETIAFTWGVMRAALLVGAVFIGGLYAFIMFCIHVWFR